MPKIKAISADRNGGYFVKFRRDESHRFYGQGISSFQAFRRYGSLPDNGILANKLINFLGKNLLSLEQQALEFAHAPEMSYERKKNVHFYSHMERESNAFHIGLLEALAPLEQKRSHDGKNTFSFSTHDEEKIEGLYKWRITLLTKQKNEESNPIHKARLAQLITRLEAHHKSTVAALRKEDRNLHSLYRKVMADFADEQRLISIYQHRADRPLDYANQSLTDAYQNASYAMEQHVFSNETPSDAQLWIVDLNATDIVVDSRRYPSMRKEDALRAACRLSGDSYSEKKAEIQAVSASNRAIDAPKVVEMAWDEAVRAEIKSKRPKEGRSYELLQQLTRPPPAKDTTLDADQDFVADTRLLNSEKAVHLHHANDLFSAIGLACVDFGKYFEGEMAAKKPVMTAATFIAMAATFGAAGMSTAGAHSMQGLSDAMCKLLTVNGKLGVTPDQLHSVVNAMSNEWLELTYSKGSLFHVLIMDGFGLPEISYALVDELLNSSDNKSTFQKLAERMSAQDLAAYTDEERQQQLIKNVFAVAVMLSSVIAVGLAADFAMKLGGVWHMAGAAINSAGDIPLEAFTNLATAHSVSAELLALISLTLTIKSAGLVIGKMMMILNHMSDELSDDQHKACLMMGNLREAYESSQANLDPELLSSDDFKFYRTHFEDVIAKKPEMEQLFGAEFLAKIGVTKPERAWYQKAADAVKSEAEKVVEYVGNRTLKPLAQMTIGTLLTAVGMGWMWDWDKTGALMWGRDKQGSDPWGLKEGRWILPKLLSDVTVMVAAAVKTISISLYGTVQRITMAVSDAVFGAVALANYAITNFPQNMGKAVVLGLGAVLITSAAVVNTVVNFAVTLSKYALTAVTATVGIIVGGLICGVARVIGSSDVFDKAWDATKTFIKSPLTAGVWFKEHVFKAVQNQLANVAQTIEDTVYGAKGGAKVMATRDATTGIIARGFDWLKSKAGDAAYAVRSLLIRSQDQRFQDAHDDYDIDEKAADVTAGFSIHGPSALHGLGHDMRDKQQHPNTDRQLMANRDQSAVPVVADEGDGTEETERNAVVAPHA